MSNEQNMINSEGRDLTVLWGQYNRKYGNQISLMLQNDLAPSIKAVYIPAKRTTRVLECYISRLDRTQALLTIGRCRTDDNAISFD